MDVVNADSDHGMGRDIRTIIRMNDSCCDISSFAESERQIVEI